MGVKAKIGYKVYDSIHQWIRRNYGRANNCEICKLKKLPKGYSFFFTWSNISGKYKRDRKDWRQLCARCHKRIDHKLKLKVEQVIEIRKLYKTNKFSQNDLAKKFNIGQDSISRIINNKYWIISNI